MSFAVIGEALIDLIADEQGNYHPHLGGSPYNVAIGLARLGCTVSYLPPLSDDGFGQRLSTFLQNAGVSTPLPRRSRLPTSIALVSKDARSQPNYRLYRQGVADKDITWAEIIANLPADLQLLHTGSLALTPSQLPKIRELLRLMRQRSVVVSMDINIRLGASDDEAAYLQGVRSLLPLADIVKASDEDLAALEYASSTYAAAQLAYAEMGGGILLLTQGTDDTYLFSADTTLSHTPPKPERLVDTVGAGDTFFAGFLAFLQQQECFQSQAIVQAIAQPKKFIGLTTLQHALAFASAAAALNVGKSGCVPPTRDEVEAFLNNRSQ